MTLSGILTLTRRGGNRIIAVMSDAAPGDTRTRQVRRRLGFVLLSTTVLPLLALATLTSGFLDRAGSPERGPAAVLLAAAAGLGVLAGGWLLIILTRPGATAAVPAAPAAREPHPLQATVDQQAVEIARYQDRLAEAVKELESTNARLKETSFKDELTGLYNRRFFFVRLEEEISRHRRFGHPVAVVLFDLDGFKEVNDEQGHIIGDETLRDIGQVLMRYSRGINVVSRYGGDEFAILLVETSKAGASLYAERIRQILSGHPYAHGMRLTASFGVASLPEDAAATAEDLVRVADEALYVAKRGGKNQVAGTRSQGAPSA
jgi:diguanylate cyclase (GGDEF)-like protein